MTDREIVDMSDDHILLAEACDEYGITAKQLATMTGYGQSTIYKFLAGTATIPMVIWRALYKLTEDPRITKLITGDVPVVEVPLNLDPAGVDAPTLRRLLESRQSSIAFEKNILDILADGKIDSLDAREIAKLKKIFPKMITDQAQIYHAITGEYDLQGVGR